MRCAESVTRGHSRFGNAGVTGDSIQDPLKAINLKEPAAAIIRRKIWFGLPEAFALSRSRFESQREE